jgi:transposase InsO family protein
MKREEQNRRPKGIRKAEFRFSVIGGLLSSPPESGNLKRELQKLADKTWQHPISGKPHRYSVATIERWYYGARRKKRNPLQALIAKSRIDQGVSTLLNPELNEKWQALYEDHPHWSKQLLFDNFKAWATSFRVPPLTHVPSYSTMRRFSIQNGLVRTAKPKCREDGTPLESSVASIARKTGIEVRSFESPYVGGLWHLDFHTGSRAILLESGDWVRPQILAILDDCSRLGCHAQWYLCESTESLVHGFSQAIQKRGRPRSLMSDRGSAMMSEEFTQGLLRLSISHDPTLEYSPYQNGKSEKFWAQIEGRLLPMLEEVKGLTLNQLNELTQVWIESEYNQRLHTEIGCTPISKFANTKSVLFDSPGSEELRFAFVKEISRRQRRTDGTVSIEGVRFEVPSAYRHHSRILIQYPSWNLSQVQLVDQKTEQPIAKLLPLDKQKNASGKRKANDLHRPVHGGKVPMEQLPPQMQKLVRERERASLPPAYLPQWNGNSQS